VIVWYRVRDLDAARAFYRDALAFAEAYVDWEDRWARFERDGCEIALAEGEPEGEEGPIATLDVDDIKAEAQRLRELGVDVGVVLELHEEMRVVDVFDPDGNRIQLAQEVS
jgi:predicted enzyme related to lactoylglutathione lyase